MTRQVGRVQYTRPPWDSPGVGNRLAIFFELVGPGHVEHTHPGITVRVESKCPRS